MNYSQATDLLSRGRNGNKKIANNTYLHSVNEGVAIKFHNTDVVVIRPNGTYLLQNGGFLTRTTKERINEFTPAKLSQRKGLWYMLDGTVFNDGVVINEKGEPLNSVKDNTEELKKKLDKMVSKYIKDFATEAIKNGLELPSAGDCFMCQFNSEDVDHLFSHIEESYFVPSLLFNAIKSRNYVNPGLIYGLAVQQPEVWIAKELTAYFRKMKPKMLAAMKNK
jgi:hypothetical protein